MYSIPPHFFTTHQFLFISQPFGPAGSYYFFVKIIFGKGDEQRVMPGFAFHKPAVKLPHVVVVEAFAQAFEAFTTAGFYQRHDEHLV